MRNLNAVHARYVTGAESLESLLIGVTNYAHAIVYTRQPTYADDLAQEITTRVWQHLADYSLARGSFRNFVRLTANAVLNRHLAGEYMDTAAVDSMMPPVADDSHDWERLISTLDATDIEMLGHLSTGHSFRDLETIYACSRKTIRHRIDKMKKKIAAGAISAPSM